MSGMKPHWRGAVSVKAVEVGLFWLGLLVGPLALALRTVGDDALRCLGGMALREGVYLVMRWLVINRPGW